MSAAQHSPTDATAEAIWSAADRLASRASGLEGLRAHRLQGFAARAAQRSNTPLGPGLAEARRQSMVASTVAPSLLEHIRSVVERPILLFKGPEVASRYPEPWLRPFIDLDLLVEDPPSARRRLLAGGFEEIGDMGAFDGHHHLPPLRLASVPIVVELHRRLSSVSWLRLPSTAELFESSVPSATGTDGVRALAPAQHASLLAAHGWSHWPLGRAGDLIDVLVLAIEAERGLIDATARSWGIERLWRTTLAAAEAVLLGAPTTWPLRTWARPIGRCRVPTAIDRRITRALSPFAAHPVPRALAETVSRSQR